MRTLRIRADLSLLREGADVAIGFGLRSLEGLGGVAEFLQHAVYEHGSLRSSGECIVFTLRNPPLRMGAFGSVRVALDGVWAPADLTWVQPGEGSPRVSLATIDRTHPVTLPIGRRSFFTLGGVDRTPRQRHVRLELLSVAIPPRVWYEFVDDLRPEATPR